MSEYSPILPLTTTSVQLLITEVGPWKGAAFGGIVAIKIFGCYAHTNYQPDPITISQSEAEQPAEIDWYDYDSYESYDQATGITDTTQHKDEEEEEDDIFSSFESLDQFQDNHVDHERHTDEDWDLFGSFERGSRISVRKEETPRGRNDDVASDAQTEEKLEKSNWPMFDSISVDAEYDAESIVEKSVGNPSNKQTTLYIIREVLFI